MGFDSETMAETYSVVSLAWNQYDVTKGFLERLKDNTPFDFQLVFTDNGSHEPIPDLVLEYFPDATLIRKKENVGCPRTRNEAMEHATGDIVFWLDNDTYVDELWYRPFLNTLEDDEVGIAGCFGKLVDNPIRFPHPFIEPTGLSEYVDGFMGYAMAMKKEAYSPIPDWNTPVNLDDIDVVLEMKKNGWKAKTVDTEPNLIHLVSKTARGWEVDNQAILKKWWQYWEPKASEVLELWKSS